jgi:hypothetical protein
MLPCHMVSIHVGAARLLLGLVCSGLSFPACLQAATLSPGILTAKNAGSAPANADPSGPLVITLTSTRGVAVANGTSLGAFTESSTFASFQNQVTPGDYSWILTLPAAVADPAVAPDSTSLSYPDGTAALAVQPITFRFFGPLTVAPDGSQASAPEAILTGIATSLSATFTKGANGVSFHFLEGFVGPAGTPASVSLSGLISPDDGTGHLPVSDSVAVRYDLLVTPEPATRLLALLGAGVLLGARRLVFRRQMAGRRTRCV